jgi:glutamate dehydrogenase (NADP+)
VLTGKGLEHGGSLSYTEATGYGCTHFMQNMPAARKDSFEGKTCLVSGSGNAARYAVEKITELGGKAVTMSNSDGRAHDPGGLAVDKLDFVKALGNVRRGRIDEYTKRFRKAKRHAGKRPWGEPEQLAFACATQSGILAEDA